MEIYYVVACPNNGQPLVKLQQFLTLKTNCITSIREVNKDFYRKSCHRKFTENSVLSTKKYTSRFDSSEES